MLIEKSRSGVYQNTPENRRLHRVGQRYGKVAQKEEDFESFADRYEKEYRKKHSGSPVKNSEIRYEASKAWDKMHSSENSRLHHVGQKYGGAKKDEAKQEGTLPKVSLSEKDFTRHVDEETAEEYPNAKLKLHYYQADEIEYFNSGGQKETATPFISEFYLDNSQSSIGGYEIYFDRADSIGTFRTKESAIAALNKYVNAMRVKGHSKPEWAYGQNGRYQWNYTIPTPPEKQVEEVPSKLGGLEFNEDKSTGERWYEGEMGGQRVRILQETVGKDDWWVVEISGHNVVDDNNKAMTFDNVQDAFEAIKQAEKIDRGVRAAEEKRHLEEIKRTNEKINAAMKKQFITEKKSAEMVEKPTSRVTFADVPRSKEVNLKKYLTDSRRKDVDRLMQTVDGMSSSAIKQAHDAAVKKFNDNFDNMKKSERASALYVIMKYKDLMNKAK